MKKYLILIALCIVACNKPQKYKMPWEDDLNNKPIGELVEAKVGNPLPDWSEGCLDIHAINSGRGECYFYILPDGTTFVVDCGELLLTSGQEPVPQKPNAQTRPYIVDANYIRHFLPKGNTAIDYALATHFHIDHIGSIAAAQGKKSENGYYLSGFTALYDEIKIKNMFDGAYPDKYAEQDGELAVDFGKFVDWASSKDGMKASRFEVGKDQITLLKNKDAYKAFKLINIVVNGSTLALDKDGKETINTVAVNKGNPTSAGFHIKYGMFDYMACGDLVSSPQNNIAVYFKDFIGKGHLDAFKAHHHLSDNGWGTQMQNHEFDPYTILNQSFYKKQPDPTLLNNIFTGQFSTHQYTWDKNLFCTNLHPDSITESPELFSQIKDYGGHIVLRVAPGGGEYTVYMLDDTDFLYKVKSIHGPYKSK